MLQMASSPSPLNPQAKSWNPKAPKSSETSISYPHEMLSQVPSDPSVHALQKPMFVQYYFYGFWALYFFNPGFPPQLISGVFPPPGSRLIFGDLDEKAGVQEKRYFSEVQENDWMKPRKFGPRMRRSYSLESQETKKKKSSLKQVWKQRKAKSDDGPSSSVREEDSTNISGKTTVMIRNIPNQYRRDDLMRFLDACCKNDGLEYDFLYLPIDFRRDTNLGYAFVNFTSATAAVKIKRLLHGFVWSNNIHLNEINRSKKICETSWAVIQGKDRLIKHFKNSNFTCDDIKYLPVEFLPPRNGSNSQISSKEIGNMTGRSGSLLPMKKKSAIMTNY